MTTNQPAAEHANVLTLTAEHADVLTLTAEHADVFTLTAEHADAREVNQPGPRAPLWCGSTEKL